MFTDRLIEHLGLINWQQKGVSRPAISEPPAVANASELKASSVTNFDEPPQLDKSEFRLLVNMLKAINHDCQYENLTYQDDHWVYQFGEKQLIFKQLDTPDTSNQMHLCTLSMLISQPELKRPVWEKLKTLKT